MQSLVQQIDGYLDEFAVDRADPELTSARDDLGGKRVMSQTIDTFGLAQTLRRTIPQLPVMDLTVSLDIPTIQIAKAANATPGDSWYDLGFNALQAIPTGPAGARQLRTAPGRLLRARRAVAGRRVRPADVADRPRS